MKQRGELRDETDSLLRACWSLAEMLFSLRQSKREGRSPDEELLGSAVQACWELCDIFRDGWTQVRPDRGTPRASQTNFFQAPQHFDEGRASRASGRSKQDSLKSLPKEKQTVQYMPETPVTEFEDTALSPDTESPQPPNIMVLGTESNRGVRWSSRASNMSSHSQSSQRTSSTATTATSTEDIDIARLKLLVLKAAINVGFSRDNGDPRGTAEALRAFVESLPAGSFGSLPAHANLLKQYKMLVLRDSCFRSALPARKKRLNAGDAAKTIAYLIEHHKNFGFLRDLFRLVFGFHMEEADSRRNVSLTV